MSLLLCVETSIRGVGATLAKFGADQELPLWQENHLDVMSSASQISGLVERGLEFVQAKASDVSGIAVSVGPGSFTGIKIGLAFAAGFTLGRREQCGIFGTPTLPLCLAALRRANPSLQALFLPATRTHGFVSFVEDGETHTQLIDLREEADGLTLIDHIDGQKAVIGEWVILEGHKNWHGTSIAVDVAVSSALTELNRVGGVKWPGAFSRAMPVPQYMRLTTAEEQREAKQLKE